MILLYLACLFPLAVYLLILALLNRGPQPAVVSGPWDFAGVLLAASGFLVIGGPVALNGLYEQARLAAMVNPSQLSLSGSILRPLGHAPWTFWLVLWLLYFLGVAVGAAYLLWRRQGSLVIYHITSEDFAVVLNRVLGRLRLEARQQGRRVELRSLGSPGPAAEFELTAWPSTRNLTLRWLSESALRGPVEDELVLGLEEVNGGGSSLSGWLLGLAGGFLLSLFVGLGVYLFLLFKALSR